MIFNSVSYNIPQWCLPFKPYLLAYYLVFSGFFFGFGISSSILIRFCLFCVILAYHYTYFLYLFLQYPSLPINISSLFFCISILKFMLYLESIIINSALIESYYVHILSTSRRALLFYIFEIYHLVFQTYFNNAEINFESFYKISFIFC